ncbi:MAG: TlyA family RNA methyltransferase, partial [Clostridia bacterium]|nr:TlyA family RNA methyltransferase [Clostridia bacterium]
IGFASLGGLKLEEAITRLSVPVEGVAVDIGASNGGFTDCLLRHGAERVYAVDVGECALPTELRADPRVVVMDDTNARDLKVKDFPSPMDTAVCDVSFISLTLILPVIADLLKEGGHAVVLVKPQFEVGKQGLTKSGVVKDERTRLKALAKVKSCAESLGLKVHGECPVPKLFEDKNVEYLLHLVKRG